MIFLSKLINGKSTFFFARFLLFILLLSICSIVKSQTDTLVLLNNNIIVGEIKSMDRGVLIIKTSYSKKNFEVKWKGVKEVYTQNFFLLNFKNGTSMNASFHSIRDGKMKITDKEGNVSESTKDDIVFIKEIDKGFFSRLYARVDLGYSLTKTNNLTQFTMDSRMGYLEDDWSVDGYFNVLISKQDSIADIQRKDAGIGYKYLLFKGFYLAVDLTFLSNTEQALDLRTNGKTGLGKYLFKNNRAYWGVIGGVAANIENFSENAETISSDRQSWEGFLGTELSLYDIGDLNLFLSTSAYPGITETGRWRVDFRMDIKYDLPLDFYIRIGSTVNYDNQPAIQGSEFDYVLTNGFGWKW